MWYWRSTLSAHSQEHLNDISHLPPRSLHTHRNTRHTSMTSPTCHLAPCTLTGTPQRHLPPASSLSAHHRNTRHTSMTSPTCHLAPCTLTGTPQQRLPPATSLTAHSQEHLNNVSHVPPRSLHTHRHTSMTADWICSPSVITFQDTAPSRSKTAQITHTVQVKGRHMKVGQILFSVFDPNMDIFSFNILHSFSIHYYIWHQLKAALPHSVNFWTTRCGLNVQHH